MCVRVCFKTLFEREREKRDENSGAICFLLPTKTNKPGMTDQIVSQQELLSKWNHFYKSKRAIYVMLPVDRNADGELSSAIIGGESVPYCLTMLDSSSIPLPPQLFEGMPQPFSQLTLEHSFYITLFELYSHRFFGNTFISPRFPGNSGNDALGAAAASGGLLHDSVVYNFPVFFHSPLSNTDSVVAVVELVLSVVTKTDGVCLSEASAGWGVLCPFAGQPSRLGDLKDVVSSSGTTEQLYVGTPRALCLLDSCRTVSELKKKLVPLQGCRFAYTLHTNKGAKDAMNLWRDHEFVDESYVIPGLGRLPVDPDAEKDVKAKGGVGAYNPYIPSLLLATPLDVPVRLPSVALFVGDIRIRFPPGIFNEVIEKLQSVRLHEFNIDPPDDQKVIVVQKYVTLGVHNGRTFIRPPHRGVLDMRDGVLVHDTSISFSGVCSHVLFVLIFQLEFIVRLPLPAKVQQQFGHPGSLDRTVVMGWTVFVPYNGSTFHQGEASARLQTGPGVSPVDDALVFRSSCVDITSPTASISITFNISAPGDASPSLPKSKLLQSVAASTLLETQRAFAEEVPIPFPGEDKQDLVIDGTPAPVYPTVAIALANDTTHSARLPERSDVFPVIKTDTGELPEEVGSAPIQIPIGTAPDTRKGNDIYFLFMALVGSPDNTTQLKKVFFTLKFWKYPMISTHPAAVDPSQFDATKARLLHQLDVAGNSTSQSGLITRFYGAGSSFESYLAKKTLQFDAWDAETLFHIGTANMELRNLLRFGKPGVKFTASYDLVSFRKVLPLKGDAVDPASSAVNKTSYSRDCILYGRSISGVLFNVQIL